MILIEQLEGKPRQERRGFNLAGGKFVVEGDGILVA